MERFHQTRELVRWAAEYHAYLKGLYSAKSSSGLPDERLRMCLGYVAKHEQHMQSELEQYLAEESSHRGVLDTWFEEAVDVPSAPLLDQTAETLRADSAEQVLDMALASSRILQDLYDQRAQHAVSSAERELFESLSGQNEAEIRRLVRNFQRLEDY